MGNFIKGTVVGFIGGYIVGKKNRKIEPPPFNQEVYEAAEKSKASVNTFKDSLQSFEGNTLDEKYSEFLRKLHNADFSHLDPVGQYANQSQYREALEAEAESRGEAAGASACDLDEIDKDNPYQDKDNVIPTPNQFRSWRRGFMAGWEANPNNTAEGRLRRVQDKLQILVHREGVNYGPFSFHQILEQVKGGALRHNDLSWYEGLEEWVPLDAMIGVEYFSLEIASSTKTLTRNISLSGLSDKR